MATDERFDELISTWLQETAPAQIPPRVLEEAAQRTRTSRQQVRWRGLLRGIDLSRSILVLGATAAIVVAAIVALSPRVGQPEVGQLPTTPDAWSRVSIDSRWATAQVDGFVAGPRGLLAILGEVGSHDMQLSVSTDGRTWTLVPNDQFPSPDVLLPPQGGSHLPAVVTTQGFLFVADGNDVWASEDGQSWQRRADRARDDDLRAGTILAVAAGGPGLVAVGSNNTAWYSEDGSDWTVAEVPAPPTESFAVEGYAAPAVDMWGVALAGDTLVAWGNATADGAAGVMVQPVLWTSHDGRSWAKVPDVSGIGWLQEVAAGPDGFVAMGGADVTDPGGIWFSADGRAWEPTEGFRSAVPSRLSIAASSAGYVTVGGEGLCDVEPCPGARAVIWTSPDGRSWSRLPDDDRFEVADPGTTANHSGAWATQAVAWDSHFVVAGAYDASPVVWISGNRSATQTPFVIPTPSSAAPADPGSPFLGVWVSTSDGDGGTQTMTVERSANASVVIVVTDTVATVCSGTSSTMTGSGSVEDGRLVIPAPDYRCDDGTEPRTPSGPPLNDQLRNLTYTHDAGTDTLSVGIGDVWRREGAEAPNPAPQPSKQVASQADVTEFLNGFLDARVAGEGAEQYVTADPPDDEIPLLYATSSGSHYERAEFERIDGIEWPYEWTAYKARLYAGDTVVEQLLFTSTEDGRPRLAYVSDGFGTDIAPTTEDGQPVAAPYDAFDGKVTLHVAHPWVSRGSTAFVKLIPEGAGPTTDGGQRNDWDRLVVMADPERTGTNCPEGSGPLDAESLADSIRSDPDLEATPPTAVGVEGAEGLMMDVVSLVGASAGCANLLGDGDLLDKESVGVGTGPTRLYLFDAPEGSSIRLLAIAISVPQSRFERAVKWAPPIVEFHAP